MSDEFSQRPFAAGTLTGLRAFRIDELGRLRGPSFDQSIFVPGENVATCSRSRAAAAVASIFAVPGSMLAHSGVTTRAQEEAVKHRVGGMTYSCGFYAYTNGSNQYHQPKQASVEAIVEGYGLCTVGSAGFRAEKARLVAIIDPRRGWFGSLNVNAGIAIDVFFVLFALLFLISGVVTRNAVSIGIQSTLTAFWIYALARDLGKKSALPWTDSATRRFRLMRRLYPDVTIYRSRKAALKVHPLSAPQPLTPDSPDFWTNTDGTAS